MADSRPHFVSISTDELQRMRRGLEAFAWFLVADDAECTCTDDDECPLCRLCGAGEMFADIILQNANNKSAQYAARGHMRGVLRG